MSKSLDVQDLFCLCGLQSHVNPPWLLTPCKKKVRIKA